jgi:hypothetical protein
VSSPRTALVPTLGAAAILLGCATVPTKALYEARAEARVAQEVGAKNDPEAAYHLRLAQDQIVTAQKWIEEGDNDDLRRAKLVLERARADAELAAAEAKAARLEAEAEEESAEIERLRQMQLPAPGPASDTPAESTGEHHQHAR